MTNEPIGYVIIDRNSKELVTHVIFSEFDDAIPKAKENFDWCIIPVGDSNSHAKLVSALSQARSALIEPNVDWACDIIDKVLTEVEGK